MRLKNLSEPTIPDDSDPLSCWEQQREILSLLTSLAVKYLAVTAYSVPVERLFSVAGKVFRADRCRLSDTRF